MVCNKTYDPKTMSFKFTGPHIAINQLPRHRLKKLESITKG